MAITYPVRNTIKLHAKAWGYVYTEPQVKHHIRFICDLLHAQGSSPSKKNAGKGPTVCRITSETLHQSLGPCRDGFLSSSSPFIWATVDIECTSRSCVGCNGAVKTMPATYKTKEGLVRFSLRPVVRLNHGILWRLLSPQAQSHTSITSCSRNRTRRGLLPCRTWGSGTIWVTEATSNNNQWWPQELPWESSQPQPRPETPTLTESAPNPQMSRWLAKGEGLRMGHWNRHGWIYGWGLSNFCL